MEDIESIAVGFLQKVLGRSKYLKAFITTNDKTPVWDGYLFVYQDSSKKKNSLYGRIPVQVKGKQVDELHSSFISYPFESSDLKNYDRDGGVILFVVEIAPNEEKIFYKDLLRSDLKHILSKGKNNNKGKKKSKVKKETEDEISIKLGEINTGNLSLLE